MIAHQGGWDELLLPALIVALVLVVPAIRRRRRPVSEERARDVPPVARDSGACAYCGAEVPEGADRCPACGFRSAAPDDPAA